MNRFDENPGGVDELDPIDARTAAELRAAFDAIVMDRDVRTVAVDPGDAHSRRRAGWYLGAAAAAAAVVGVVVVTDVGSQRTNRAVAEWSPTPVPVSPEDRAAIVAACETAADMTRIPDAVEIEGVPMQPQFDGALIDMRGAIAAVVASTDDLMLVCSAYHSPDIGWYALGGGAGTGAAPLAPTASSVSNDDASLATVSGAAPDAVTVEFSIDGGPTGTSTVVDGRFVGWLPSSWDGLSESGEWGIEVRYLDADGHVVRTATL